MTANVRSQPLTGKALLSKINEIAGLSRKEKARACGYVSDDGKRVQVGRFLKAVLEAKGIEVDAKKPGDGHGKKPSYRVSVQQNGNILIGAVYTKMMNNVQAGDEFEIKLGRKHIHLKQIEEED